MTRVDYNETWEKLPDGSMRLIERVEHLVSDEELEPERLAALAQRPLASLSPTEKDQLLEDLIKRFF